MKETVYLMVLVEVQSSLKHISDTVHEIETEAALTVSDTRNVKILKTELLLTRVRNPKKH